MLLKPKFLEITVILLVICFTHFVDIPFLVTEYTRNTKTIMMIVFMGNKKRDGHQSLLSMSEYIYYDDNLPGRTW